ncbi:hypothetical protein E3P99_01305 [Wallemia hederae]|uniref:Glutamine-dependent NAD(+) synthetase n=1 Tax=Wallemia hederae TaxID=1540922 RepID=A0A4T0FSG3_9BASI|nr:hypothetical protein E3P99_01305 [Wallemia hederae]
MHLITLATSLNQWALDFQGNYERILESIKISKARGASLRVGPELEITGYGCLDHHLEGDTILHSWEILAKLLRDEETHGIICDIGMPVRHKNVTYNCRVIISDGKVVLIRPKMWMANDGNYRELRHFTPWLKHRQTEDFFLPRIIQSVTQQTIVPIGDIVMSTLDTCVGVELCEELFTPGAPHVNMGLDGVEIFTNSSGSHHELRKLNRRFEPIKEATLKLGGIYLYSNQRGCDGDRLYYDGCAMILMNGEIIAQGPQFGLSDVDVVTATVDIEDVRSRRTSISRNLQAAQSEAMPRVHLPKVLSYGIGENFLAAEPSAPVPLRIHAPEEEIALGPACWLWDYLRRSRTQGYFLALSGGIDSCASATIVSSMCRQVVKACQEGVLTSAQEQQVIADVRRITGEPDDSTYVPWDHRELCNRIFYTSYMGTENSSDETRQRAKDLANDIGSYHVDINIDAVIAAIRDLFAMATGLRPKFKVHGGSYAENIALQNIQARLRMLLSYLFAQLLPWVRGRPGGLLVLASSNVDECLRGYLTKYDCSSADLNPIGSISKTDLKRFIGWAQKEFDLPILEGFLHATPTAELEPITQNYVQSDEVDMGMTYDQLSAFGRLRKVEKCGPYSMFTKLLCEWKDAMSPAEIAEKVKKFWFEYSRNRHKMTTMTPSYHAESYSPEDNRFDLRPFLYNARFPYQFEKIDATVKRVEELNAQKKKD